MSVYRKLLGTQARPGTLPATHSCEACPHHHGAALPTVVTHKGHRLLVLQAFDFPPDAEMPLAGGPWREVLDLDTGQRSSLMYDWFLRS